MKNKTTTIQNKHCKYCSLFALNLHSLVLLPDFLIIFISFYVIRNIFNQKKNEWRSASMDVIKTKTALYSCEIEYNNIIEYVNLTTEYIKFLEQNQKEKVYISIYF